VAKGKIALFGLNFPFIRGFSKLSRVGSSMGNACIQKLILPAEVSRQDTSNGVRVAYVNFYDIWVKNMVKYFKY
jgi:hypothetical protein